MSRSSSQAGHGQVEFNLPPPKNVVKDGLCASSRIFAPAKPTIVFDTYWRLAAARQDIYFRRIRNEPPPWSDDPVLRVHKFTNAYRAADRTSQFAIRNVICSGDESAREVFFRTILFKVFNRIETWRLLCQAFGAIAFSTFSLARYDKVLTEASAAGQTIYSAAYIMPSGGRASAFSRKHQMHLDLIKRMVSENLPEQIADAKSMGKAFDLIRAYPTIGDFLGYQYVTDLNYSSLTNFSEMEFVVPGPGARDGIRKCFSDLGGLTEPEIIKLVASKQAEAFDLLGIKFQSLWGRPLQLIDCQNLFCEVDKYSRVVHPEFSGLTGRTRIKQKFRPSDKSFIPWFPPKWKLNGLVTKSLQLDESTRSKLR